MNGLKIYKKRLLNLLSPIECLNIIEWSEKHIESIPDSPFSGRLNLHRTPFLLEPLRQTCQSGTTLSVMNFPVQIGKSLILKLLALYQIHTDPSPILFLADTPANSEDFCDTSLVPMLRQNRIFDGLISTSAGANMKETKIFNNGAILWNRGASNLKNLQRRSVKLLLADECWLYPQGHIEEAIKRITRFEGEGGRAVLVSQSGEVGEEFANYFDQTNQQEYMWRCPHCGNHNAYNMEMVKWDMEAVNDDGSADFETIRNTLRYTCPHCSTEWEASKEQRERFNQSSIWVPMNESASSGKIGFHTSAFCFLDAFSLVTEYIHAKSRAKDGDFSQLKIFYQKRLALPWSEHQEVIDTSTKEVEGQTIGKRWDKMGYITKQGQLINKDAPNFKREVLNGALPLIFMAVDVQQDSFYYAIRAFSDDPQNESMLIDCGHLFTWEDVMSKRTEFMIPNSNMGIDSGYRAKEVYAISVDYRCYAMKGHQQRSFKREAAKVIGRKLYESHAVAAPQSVQVQTIETLSNGAKKTRIRKALLLSFAANAAKDWIHFNRKRTQRGKASFNVPEGTPMDYHEQMNSERRVQEGRFSVWRPRKSKVDNHFLDCESMIYALALNLFLTLGNGSLDEHLT